MGSSGKPGDSPSRRCPRCRGRGWKHVGGRASAALSVSNDRKRVTQKRRCLDCDGSGKERK